MSKTSSSPSAPPPPAAIVKPGPVYGADLLSNASFELDPGGHVIPNSPPQGYESYSASGGLFGWTQGDTSTANAFEVLNSPFGGGPGAGPLNSIDGHHGLDMAASIPNPIGGNTRLDIAQHFNAAANGVADVALTFAEQLNGTLHTPAGDHLQLFVNNNLLVDFVAQDVPGIYNNYFTTHVQAILQAGDNLVELRETDSNGSVLGTPGQQPLVGFAVDSVHINPLIHA